MGWIGCVRCEKFQWNFVAQTFALVRPVFTEFRKATKRSQMQKNESLGSKRVDRVCSSSKTPTRLHGMNFSTSSARFAPSFVGQPNGLHPNSMQRTKARVRGPMGLIGCVHCERSRRDFVARTFALITPVHPVLHRV